MTDKLSSNRPLFYTLTQLTIAARANVEEKTFLFSVTKQGYD